MKLFLFLNIVSVYCSKYNLIWKNEENKIIKEIIFDSYQDMKQSHIDDKNNLPNGWIYKAILKKNKIKYAPDIPLNRKLK